MAVGPHPCLGHLGLAISLTERDGDLVKADANVDAACACLGKLNLDTQDPSSDERFPTRATAAVLECRGFIRFRQEKLDEAIDILEDSVRQFPHSRAYFELALALEQRALADPDARDTIIPRARRLLEHALRLAPTDEPPDEIRQAMERLAWMMNAKGSSAHLKPKRGLGRLTGSFR